MNLKTKIAGIKLNTPIINASGPIDSTLPELEAIAGSNSSAIMMKSCTIKPRNGNTEPRYARLPLGAIQSMGLPNLGYEEYIKYSSFLKSKYKKPVIASVVGFSVDEYKFLVNEFQKSEVDLIEVNLSCPNIIGKPQVAYDFNQTKQVLEVICGLGEKPIGIKLPPYFDPVHVKEMAKIINNSNISFVTLINSVGNTLIIDPETEAPVIKPKGGLGGLCGEYIKPIALANVKMFREVLKEEISIFGVGGVLTGTDVFEFLLAGADAVQIGSVFEKEGESCFRRLEYELKDIMKSKKYANLSDVIGKLGD